MPLLLSTVTEEVHKLYNTAAPKWGNYTPTQHDMNELEMNSIANDQFDKKSLKHRVWTEYKNGSYKCVGKQCEYGIVVALLPPETNIPLEDWGRIFQWFGRAASGEPWKVYWFASPVKRTFPNPGEELGPGHVNGGYTFPCSTKGIFIYRLEEATRVLIHELLHAACLNPADASLPVIEATVETWAEILLIAFRSRGSPQRAQELWRKQADWIVATNHKAGITHGVKDNTDYAWRYMNGRAEIYEGLGFALPRTANIEASSLSTRFTHPILE